MLTTPLNSATRLTNPVSHTANLAPSVPKPPCSMSSFTFLLCHTRPMITTNRSLEHCQFSVSQPPHWPPPPAFLVLCLRMLILTSLTIVYNLWVLPALHCPHSMSPLSTIFSCFNRSLKIHSARNPLLTCPWTATHSLEEATSLSGLRQMIISLQ